VWPEIKFPPGDETVAALNPDDAETSVLRHLKGKKDGRREKGSTNQASDKAKKKRVGGPGGEVGWTNGVEVKENPRSTMGVEKSCVGHVRTIRGAEGCVGERDWGGGGRFGVLPWPEKKSKTPFGNCRRGGNLRTEGKNQ